MVEWKKLGEVCSNVYAGGTPSTKHSEYYDGNIPWIRSGEVDFNVIKTAERNITEEGYKNSSAKKIRKKSVVMAMTGATVAKTAVVEIETTANQSVCAMETDENIIGYKYLYYFLAKNYFTIKSSAQGALTSINLAMIKDILIPIPSLEEQERIVGILDTFTASIDNIKAQIEQRRKQYEHYRNTLLTFNKDDNSVEWKTLGEIGEISAGGDVPQNTIKETNPIENYCFPVYSNGKENNSLYGYSTSYSIAKQAVTISARGTIGWHCVREAYFTPIIRLITVIPDEKLLSAKYLDYALYVTRIGGDNGGIPQLTVPSIKNCEIPIPTLARQQEIVSILDTFEASITNLEAQLEQRQKQYEYYREELLTNLS